MPVVSLREIVDRAFRERYGVPAINIVNDLTLEAVLAGAVEARSPVIVQTSVKTVLMYGQKHDLNNYLLERPDAPVHTLTDIIDFNNAHASVALKYGQAIFLAADQLDTSPGSVDTLRYQADRALDLALTRGGLDAVFNGPDGLKGTDDDFDAILFPQNRGAAAPAKAGYPSIVVPGGYVPPVAPVVNPAPFGVTFSGRAFSEPTLLGLAYNYEQATRHRRPPASAPPLPTDHVDRH